MRRTLAQYFKKTIKPTSEMQNRPVSAILTKSNHKNMSLDHSIFKPGKQSLQRTYTGSSIRSKLTYRNYSSLENKKCKTSSLLTTRNGNKPSNCRYQVINSHCMKKVALLDSEYRLNTQIKKQSLGTDLKNCTKIERRQFLGKRLKCLRKGSDRHIKTQYQQSQNQNDFQVKGFKVI